MADLSIRKDFVDGVHDIFTTLFNDGKNDGIKLYLMSDKTKTNLYKESKFKRYKEPIMLVAHARIDSVQGKEFVEDIKHHASFVVPLKEFQDHNISVSRSNLNELRKGIIEFRDVFYSISDVLPRVYIEDVFLFYHFVCSEESSISSVLIESGD